MRIVLQSLRNKGLLDLARDIQFLFEALAFPFPFDQPRFFQNACRLRPKASRICRSSAEKVATRLESR